MTNPKKTVTLIVLVLVALLAPALMLAQADGEIGLPIEFSGTVQSVSGATLIVNNQTIDTGMLTLTTVPRVGDLVGVRGQLLQDGRIIASSIVILTAQVTPQPTTIPLPTPQPGSQGVCPRPASYWAQGDSNWTVTTLMLGTQSYNERELRALLSSTASGDVSLRLAQQLITAKLNVAAGSSTDAVGSYILQADTLLSQVPGRLPYGILPTAVNGPTLLTTAELLDSYNRSLTTRFCQPATPDSPDTPDEPVAPQRIIIEGPVVAINGNLIRLYNFDVLVQPDNPILRRLQQGDLIRVDGTLEMRANVVFLIATSVVMVDGQMPPRDDSSGSRDQRCDNPPPDHAPAHGWRWQCEDGPHPGRGNGRGNGRGHGDDGSGSRSRS